MFVGNNFHTGGGAADGTFTWGTTESFSTSAQSGYASLTVCGWDRWFLGTKGSRQYVTGAINPATELEVNSDIKISTHPNESQFILRDFVTVGDAVRIKLPHLNWGSNGDKKNQYLWIENHQKISEFDVNKNPCNAWSKGLYTYLQVGKDLLSGPELYGGIYESPNELNDHLFPLTAERNYDFYYDLLNKNFSWENCAWGNYYVPYGKMYPDGTVRTNPFTGASDVSGTIIDSDIDGTIIPIKSGPTDHGVSAIKNIQELEVLPLIY